MTQRNLYIAFIFTIISVYSVSAQTNRTKTLINAALHGWEYEVRAGFSIGGTSPIPCQQKYDLSTLIILH